MNLQEFNQEFLEEIRNEAAISETDPEDVFIKKSFEILSEIGEITDPIDHYYRKVFGNNRVMQINGYAFDDADKSLALFLSDFDDCVDTKELNKSAIEDTLYNKMNNFLRAVLSNKITDFCDESDNTLNVAKDIRNRFLTRDGILKVKYYVLTNKRLSSKIKKIKIGEIAERPVEINIWYIDRYFEYINSTSTEPLEIDLEKFTDKSFPCIKANIGEQLGYDAYVAVIPGRLLAELYVEYGSRILEGNVRAFLGMSGQKSVNAGIKRTIEKEPSNFFIYNNGVAITASSLIFDERNNMLNAKHITDMQIINGGQTTATLATVCIKEPEKLDGIFVPAKITVINDREKEDEDGTKYYDKMVSYISRYANSQNKVTAADFFSNHPFHVQMEKLSKRHLAAPKNGEHYSTGWYYERTRKKYNQEIVKLSKQEARNFMLKFPKSQVITKDKLAKYIFSAEQYPHVVSKGANWAMKLFGDKIDEIWKTNSASINEMYFKEAISKAIIFNETDKLVQKSDWYQKGGYKLNIIPYTISYIMWRIPKNKVINWADIWSKQALTSVFLNQINVVAEEVNKFISKDSGIIVTEYCKKAETWEAMKQNLNVDLIDEFIDELVDIQSYDDEKKASKKDQKQYQDIDLEVRVFKLGSNYWAQVLDIGLTNKLLSEKEVSILKIAAVMEKTGKIPTAQQAKILLVISDRFEEKGILYR